MLLLLLLFCVFMHSNKMIKIYYGNFHGIDVVMRLEEKRTDSIQAEF